MFVQNIGYYPMKVLWDREREWDIIIETNCGILSKNQCVDL
jgi:hypothetical protein